LLSEEHGQRGEGRAEKKDLYHIRKNRPSKEAPDVKEVDAQKKMYTCPTKPERERTKTSGGEYNSKDSAKQGKRNGLLNLRKKEFEAHGAKNQKGGNKLVESRDKGEGGTRGVSAPHQKKKKKKKGPVRRSGNREIHHIRITGCYGSAQKNSSNQGSIV